MPTVLLDFDKTLINSPFWRRELVNQRLHQLYGIDPTEFTEVIEEVIAGLPKYTDFGHEHFLPVVTQKYGLNADQVTEVFFDPELTQAALYPEVPAVVKALHYHYPLGVFSEANLAWQEQRLTATGLRPFFQPHLVFILARKETPAAMELVPPSIIVDDNPSVIAFLQTQPKITPIWINRESSEVHDSVPTIHSLDQLPELITQLTPAHDAKMK